MGKVLSQKFGLFTMLSSICDPSHHLKEDSGGLSIWLLLMWVHSFNARWGVWKRGLCCSSAFCSLRKIGSVSHAAQQTSWPGPAWVRRAKE